MEAIIKIFVYIHAFFGGLGLIAGMAGIVVKKGSRNHKIAGKIFSLAMIVSALISLVVSRMPNHHNLFLFLIGIFTIYLVLAGNRALTLRSEIKPAADNIDKSISGPMVITSVIMIITGITGLIQQEVNSILYVFFGSVGLSLALRDFKTFRTFTTDKKAWLKSHIGRMVGAFIASITAFMVVGLHIGTLLVWVMPTILGSGYIIYWIRKIKPVAAAVE